MLFHTERVKAIYTYEFAIHVPFNNITSMDIGKTRVLIKTRQNKKQNEDEYKAEVLWRTRAIRLSLQ